MRRSHFQGRERGKRDSTSLMASREGQVHREGSESLQCRERGRKLFRRRAGKNLKSIKCQTKELQLCSHGQWGSCLKSRGADGFRWCFGEHWEALGRMGWGRGRGICFYGHDFNESPFIEHLLCQVLRMLPLWCLLD